MVADPVPDGTSFWKKGVPGHLHIIWSPCLPNTESLSFPIFCVSSGFNFRVWNFIFSKTISYIITRFILILRYSIVTIHFGFFYKTGKVINSIYFLFTGFPSYKLQEKDRNCMIGYSCTFFLCHSWGIDTNPSSLSIKSSSLDRENETL